MELVPVAVTGIGIVCAAGDDVDTFWKAISDGQCCLGPLPGGGFDEVVGPIAGSVDDTVLSLRLSELPEDAYANTDRATRMALIAARDALLMSDIEVASIPSSRRALVIGKCQGDDIMRYVPMHESCNVLGRFFDFNGPRLMISTACAASTNAVGVGFDKLSSGEADIVLAGGSDSLSRSTFRGFTAMQSLSPRPCAPYTRSDGLTLGEGAAFLVLERLEDAERRGAIPLAEIRGYGLSADAFHPTAPDPAGRGAVAAMRRALCDADIALELVSYVNGHGTGTPANDRMERRAMRALFGRRSSSVPLSSTKSMVGHTLGAAGAVELVASIQAIRSGRLPPTANAESDATDLDIVPNVSRPAPVDVVISNNYAFGGNNASVVLSKPRRGRRVASSPRQRVVVTGLGGLGGLGFGLEEWHHALTEGASPITRLSAWDATAGRPAYGASMPSLEGRRFASATDWRHMDTISRQALGATRFALDDAQLKLTAEIRDGMALIFGTGFGPAPTTLRFLDQRGGDVSAVSFSQTTMNAPAGKVGQVLGLRGPASTFTSGAVSGTIALGAAADLIATERANSAVVLATDELFPELIRERGRNDALAATGISRPYDRERSGCVLGAAAVAIVLESEGSAAARDRAPYCELRSVVHGSDNYDNQCLDPSGTRFAEIIELALARTEIDPRDVQLIAGSASGHPEDRAELAALSRVFESPVALTAPKSLTGDCESASGLVNVLVCALGLSGRAVPGIAGLQDPEACPAADYLRHGSRIVPVRNAVALDATRGAAYGAVVLSEAR